jgi:hypothetical protein
MTWPSSYYHIWTWSSFWACHVKYALVEGLKVSEEALPLISSGAVLALYGGPFFLVGEVCRI